MVIYNLKQIVTSQKTREAHGEIEANHRTRKITNLIPDYFTTSIFATDYEPIYCQKLHQTNGDGKKDL